ncbi:MAG: hypothetical protein MJZ37_08355 [Bacilli bacterium]|nr:hypothetical protein [Bacilli bacterium]
MRDRDTEERDVVNICVNCPYNKCIEDNSVDTKVKCGRYKTEIERLKKKYGVKILGHSTNEIDREVEHER